MNQDDKSGPAGPATGRDSMLPGRRYWAVMLSAVVLPGLGQCLQKRWRTGVMMALLFLGLSAGLLVSLEVASVEAIQTYFSVEAGAAPLDATVLYPVLPWLAAALAVYLWNLVDIFRRRPARPR